MKRSPPLHLECLEERCTPTTLTVSFVPDGTQIGTQQSQLYHDLNALAPTAVWQQGIFNMLQSQMSQSNVTLQLVADDGASMNAPAPQDGQIRIAAVDQAFQTGGAGMALPGGAQMIGENQPATFGIGLGPVGPNGPPPTTQGNPTPPPTTPPSTPPSQILPVLLPLPGSVGNLFPTNSSSSNPPAPTNPYNTNPPSPTGP